MIDGYGTTETCGFASASHALDPSSCTSGIPLLCNEIKLIDVPVLDIIVMRDKKGEVNINKTVIIVFKK